MARQADSPLRELALQLPRRVFDVDGFGGGDGLADPSKI